MLASLPPTLVRVPVRLHLVTLSRAPLLAFPPRAKPELNPSIAPKLFEYLGETAS